MTGIQEEFNIAKIIFAFHVRISITAIFQTSHLIRLPHWNFITIPNKPYLILDTKCHQFENLPCNKPEWYFLCQKKLVLALKQFLHLIFREDNNKFILIFFPRNTVKKLNHLSFNKISKVCTILVETSTFTNKEETISRNSLILLYAIKTFRSITKFLDLMGATFSFLRGISWHMSEKSLKV